MNGLMKYLLARECDLGGGPCSGSGSTDGYHDQSKCRGYDGTPTPSCCGPSPEYLNPEPYGAYCADNYVYTKGSACEHGSGIPWCILNGCSWYSCTQQLLQVSVLGRPVVGTTFQVQYSTLSDSTSASD